MDQDSIRNSSENTPEEQRDLDELDSIDASQSVVEKENPRQAGESADDYRERLLPLKFKGSPPKQ